MSPVCSRKSGGLGQPIDLVDRRLQRRDHIRIGRLVESHVAVADLDKAEVPAFAGMSIHSPWRRPGTPECHRSSSRPARTRPCHALQKSAPVDAIVVEILQFLIDKILLFVRHLSSVVCSVLSG